jgi:hypothetical protein
MVWLTSRWTGVPVAPPGFTPVTRAILWYNYENASSDNVQCSLLKKKYDKEMFGTKELQSLEYPNKKDWYIKYQSLSLCLRFNKNNSLYNHKLAFCFPSRKNYLDQVQTVNTFTFLSPLYAQH